MQQTTQTIMLVKPANFGFNEETSVSNAFQQKVTITANEIKDLVSKEFDLFVDTLHQHGVQTLVINDTELPIKPDAIFPNNWISMHADGTLILYPMCTPNRRLERRQDVVDLITSQYQVERIIDLSHYEQQNIFLEGTGSIVFNHKTKKAYACISVRTYVQILQECCTEIGYTPIFFTANDADNKAIYHTNVMMCISSNIAVVCLDSVTDIEEKNKLKASLQQDGLTIVEINFKQMESFAGNMLAISTANQAEILVMSNSAFESLTTEQINLIQQFHTIVPMHIKTIETIGGGSARCMMAEIFLSKRV